VPTPVLDLTSPANDIPPDTLTRQGSSVLGKDEFLKLLVAQLANQDPTQPQDSSAFVAQLAQFSALEQQQNTVGRLDTLLMGQAFANQTSAASFIGKDVTFRGGHIQIADGGAGMGIATLTAPADKMTVTVSDATGRTVRVLQLGPQAAGDVQILWDGRDANGIQMPAGTYSFSAAAYDADGQAVAVDVTTRGTVSGVAYQSGAAVLKVGGATVPMSDVTSINERNTP
jgi:flagellar basal-body rod modification protein FlgD